MSFMDIFLSFSKHCRCSFYSLTSRCVSEKSKWKRSGEINTSKLPNIPRFFVNRQWTENIYKKYFSPRRKIHKSKISNFKKSISKFGSEEKLKTTIVKKDCVDLSVSGCCKNEQAWRSVFVDLTKKDSMTYLIFIDQKTLYPEVFELGITSLWKQTKRAFRDVFREYRIPVEINTSEKVFFGSGKFVRFMKDHGIVMATKSEIENNLTNVLGRVKVLIHTSRFWHEELRKLRENISKSLLVTEDKYVQVDDVYEDDMKFSMSDSSSEDSSDARNDDFVTEKYEYSPKVISTPKEGSVNKPLLLTKRKQMIGKNESNVNIVRIDCLRSIRIKTKKYPHPQNSFVIDKSNKINSNVSGVNKLHPTKISLARNVTRIHHCAIDQNLIPVPGIWNRTKKRLIMKMNDYYFNHEGDSTFHENYNMLNYSSGSSAAESNSNDDNNKTVYFSGSNEIFLKLHKKGSGDNYSANDHDFKNTREKRNGLTSNNLLIKFPIEMLPIKYDNLFITQKDLEWKAVVVDVLERSSKCYYMFIDCASQCPELFLQIDNTGYANVKFLIDSLCRLWQIHGKPIEIHSPKGSIFSSKKLSRFIEKYDMFFYYDSPFLRNDMNIGHVWMNYKNILGKGNIYSELLKIQRNNRKMNREKEEREADKKLQKTPFSLNMTTIVDAANHFVTNSVEGILQKENIDSIQRISWRRIMVDEIYSNDYYYILFIDIETFYPEIIKVDYSSKLHSAKLLIRTFRIFFNKKSTSQEIHVADRRPFNIKGVIRFMKHIGVSYFRQSRYFNGGHCVYKCLEHMKSLISQSKDLKLAIYHCKKKPLPWLGLSPQQMANGNRMNPLFDGLVPPWAEIIIDIFSHGRIYYLIVFDYDSLYPECFEMHSNIFTNMSVKIIRACKRAFSVLGCPSNLWTFNRDFFRSSSFLKFLRIRGVQQSFLSPQKEREISSLLASFRQKLTTKGSFNSALLSIRGTYNRSIDTCPVRRLREKETAASEALRAAIHQKKHVRFNLSSNRFDDSNLSDSDENY